ncbi:antirestriction protein [Klebsiella pneumoniae subsp. pneumoniae]|uniref:Antirestriction protein n=1 Tax=Klebsiella pneumoniae subsp. pneumoniae TaxID=72407 RepID=A0A378ALD9_KLEPN|nr:antirestriction protein [Klebsiella pneumoniae subsp. pneumoniae]
MNTQHLQFAEQAAITASVVPDELRIGFWPQHFGSIPQWITLEPRIFAWMDRLCSDYHGGIWTFYTLNNGGAFMAPEADEDNEDKWTLFNSMNGNGLDSPAKLQG